MGTHGIGVFGINSKFASGSLVFYEKAVGRTTTGDVLTIGTADVKVGGTDQDIDFTVYVSGGGEFKIDSGNATIVFNGTITSTSTLTSNGNIVAGGSVTAGSMVDNGNLTVGGSVTAGSMVDNGNMNIGGAAAVTGNITSGNTISSTNTTDASSTITGTLKTAGGAGVAKALWVGGGINIDTCTTGISVAANIVIPNLINVGTLANPSHWDGVASNILIYQENTDTTPGSITANKFSLSAAQSAAVTSGRLETFRAEVKSYSTNAVTADMRALVGQVEFSGDMTYIGSSGNDFAGAYGVIASIWSASNVTANSGNTGHLYPLGIFFGLETGTSLSGEDAYIYIYNYGKVCPQAVLKLYNASTPAAPTYLIDHQGAVLGSSSGPFTTDSVATNSGASDGCIKVLVGSTVYEIPIFAE